MRIVSRSALSVVLTACVVAAAALTGCGSAERPPRTTPPNFPGDGCAGLPDTALVELIDDKKLLVVDNIVPAINSTVATEVALRDALNRVSNSLDQFRLIRLNKATDTDKKTPKAAAEEYAERVKLTDNLTKGSGRKIVVGAAAGNENETLAHLYRIALAGAGYDATVAPAGERTQYVPALLKGEIHVVPEYVGALAEYLNRRINGEKAPAVADGDLDKTLAELTKLGRAAQGPAGSGIAFGKTAEASNQDGFAITKALADKYHIRTLSEFAEQCSGHKTSLGGRAECKKDKFCLAGLERSYGLAVGEFTTLDAGGPKTKSTLTEGKITIGQLSTSDATLAS